MQEQTLLAVAILLCATVVLLGAVKAVTLIKQGTLMNWRRYREALLLTGERPGIRVVRLIHRDRTKRYAGE